MSFHGGVMKLLTKRVKVDFVEMGEMVMTFAEADGKWLGFIDQENEGEPVMWVPIYQVVSIQEV